MRNFGSARRKKNETRYTGRDWFPLAGSIGSDAQALPAGSRTPNLCAKCLFAVHYLPQGVILRDGRLAVFQSTSKEFFYNYVSLIVQDIDNRISADNFQTCGSKEGSAAVIKKTLDTMSQMKFIDPGTSLFVWLFSNGGTGPECSIDEIPNDALQFLFEVNREPLQREEIMQLVRKNKNPEYSFMNSIEKGADYTGLYPNKKYSGVSPELFVLYQTKIRKVTNHSLSVACKIARHIKESFADAKKFEDFKRDFKNNLAQVKKQIAELIGTGELTFSDYLVLFAKNQESITVNGDAWKFISYYLYHTDWQNPDGSQPPHETANNGLLTYVSAILFEDQLARLGDERFKKEVVDKFTLGKITPSWLKRQFLKSAIRHEDFTYETWTALFRNEQGKESPYEPLFRFRLMWSEWLRTNDMPKIVPPYTKPSPTAVTGLPADAEKTMAKIVQDYVDRRGLLRFKKDVIDQLITGEKGLHWLRTKLSTFDEAYSDDDYWEQFCLENGNSIANLRLFQLNLYVNNLYREQAFKSKQTY